VRIAVIAVSKRGLDLAGELLKLYPGADIYVPQRFALGVTNSGEMNLNSGVSDSKAAKTTRATEATGATGDQSPDWTKNVNQFDGDINKAGYCLELLPLEGGFTGAVGRIFQQYEALVFISAVAVAVRGIAPSLRGKAEDPAVVVVDEGGRYAISLLSGHLGGANQLTGDIAGHLNAEPVVTTATDGQGMPAFDDLARRHDWQIENLSDMKKVSAALLEEREIMLYSSRPLDSAFRQELGDRICFADEVQDLARAENGAVLITNSLEVPDLSPGLPYIILRPRTIAVGMGCRRGVPAEEILAAVKKAFNRAGFSANGLSCLATGEFKADEPGLIEAAEQLGVPLKIFRREEIAAALGDSATSEFVEEQVGVGAVAEPCARLGSGGGEIILPVQRGSGITIALAEAKIIWPG